ncbi:hypothetical protein WA538_003555 [Blastocystis sp. DL]
MNILMLITGNTIIQIGCTNDQTATLRGVLRSKFRTCSVIAAMDVSRKKNKFQWARNYMTVLTSRDILFFEDDKLEQVVYRLTPADQADTIQIPSGSESNDKNLIELKIGDKPTLISTANSQLCGELYHVLFFVLKGWHLSLPPPPAIAWSLPLLTAYNSGALLKSIFVREAVYQGIPEEIRPWVWKKLCESLLKGGVVLSKQDIQTLVSAVPFVPESVTETISQMTCEQTIKDDVLLLCKYVQMTQPSQTDFSPMCHLGQYVLQTLPEDVAVVVFQTFYQSIYPIWLTDNLFQDIETKVFLTVCEKLVPDVVQWSRSCPINWKRLLRCWITELFVMNRQSVNRLWSILLFEGYGALFPMLIAILSSNKQLFLGKKPSSECQDYLEKEFLKQVVNIGDIVLNFRVLIAPNQSTSRFFELSYIRGLRLQCLENYAKELQMVNKSTKQKSELLDTQLRDCDKYLNALDNYLRDVHTKIESIQESAKNDQDMHVQYLRLRQIEEMFSECRPHLTRLVQYLKTYSLLLQQRILILLDALDSMTTISNTTSCIPEMNQIDALQLNLKELTANIHFVGLRADIISVLMAAQVCMWDYISIGWHVMEIRMRTVHSEMSWMNSLEMKEMTVTKDDYMSFMVDSALKIAQVSGLNVLSFMKAASSDLQATLITDMVEGMKEVYSRLQDKWASISEMGELEKEFEELTKQTGFTK